MKKSFWLVLLLLPSFCSAATLAERLMAIDPDVRTAAQKEAAALAPDDLKKVVLDLTRRLTKEDIDEREHAAEALGLLGPGAEGAIPALRKSLNDELPYVRVKSAEALAKIGPAAIPTFIEALKNENAEVRAIGASALGHYGRDASRAVPDLVKLLEDPDSPVRQRAARALEQMGPDAGTAVMEHLETGPKQSRSLDLQILAGLKGTDAALIPRLIKQLDDPDKQIRFATTKALLHQSQNHVSELAEGLMSESPAQRAQVADVLADLGKRGASTVPRLIELLKDTTPEVRASAARALGKMGSDAASAVPELKNALKDSDAAVANRAQEALTNIAAVFGGEIPEEPKTATEAQEPAKPVAVKKRPSAPAVKKPVVVHKKAPKKSKAAPPPPPATPEELLVLAQSTETAKRSAADQEIILRSSETIPVLIPALQTGSTTVAEICADLLEKIGSPEAKTAADGYRKRMTDKKTAGLLRDLRQEGKTSDDAAQALVKLGAAIVKPVAQILADPRPTSRRAAAAVLNNLGAVSQPATAQLIDATDDKDAGVRQQASQALAKIGTPEAQKALRFFPVKDKIRRVIARFIH